MNNVIETIVDEKIGDKYFKINHHTGLQILVYPKADFSVTYAMFSTRYGSVDTSFKLEGGEKVHTVPAGIAHFLEHKLFESEQGDAFTRYAATGASANAYTSFENTCYLFSTTENFYEALEILLDFVQSPYFTKETVEKEQGIIGQEIKMYDDDPQWKVMFNLLTAMYKNHTVKEDIAGTVESISKITPEYLYDCYNTFYNLSNMSLVIAGNVDEKELLKFCEPRLKKGEPVKVNRFFEKEPPQVVKHRIEEKLSVAVPLFQIGYKENISGTVDEKTIAVTEILLDILGSDSSVLYKKLYDADLINDSYSYEYFEGEGFSAVLFGGESNNPEKILEEINLEVERLKKEGIDEGDFIRAKKSIYGANIAGLNSASTIANALTALNFKGRELFRYINSFATITVKDIEDRLSQVFNKEYSALSVILPAEEE